MLRRIRTTSLVIVIAAVTAIVMTSATAADGSRPVSVRIRWGGGTPQAWGGRIAVVAEDGGPPPKHDWQTLSGQRDASATTYEFGGSIVVRHVAPTASDGVEITIHDWHRAKLVVTLGPVTTGTAAVNLDLPVIDVLETTVQEPLDGEGNRLSVERAAGDPFQVEFEDPAGLGIPLAFGSIRHPGERLRLRITPLLLMKPGGGDVELRARLSPARHDAVIDSRVLPMAPGSQLPDTTTRSGQTPTAFPPVSCEFTLPNDEGAFDIVIEAVERRGLRWNRQLATRRIQVVAIASEPPAPAVDEPWKIIYDLDPGSPRLHERIRRLPTRGLQAVPKPSITMPAMPLPSFTRPSISMPRMPEVPLPNVPLPAVPLPDMASLVPRLGGLLATGHSTITPHPLGPMLRLPRATNSKTPSWEGIVIANARPGIPHAVEIDYPTDQRATVAACVLESDAAGATVEVRHAGGFEVASTAYDGHSRIETHRFVFWPTTRQPLLVIANPMTHGTALVGRVRVRAGPARLPAAQPSSSEMIRTAGARRMTLALVPSLDITQQYGGPTHVDAESGRPTTDWISHLIAIRHTVDAIRAQGLSGCVVTAYAGGAATWPSTLTRGPPRWAATDPSDSIGHDLLTATARVCAREGVSLVPGLCFNGAIPSLESLRASPEGNGIVCVGADGRPRTTASGPHYNILDPRVQREVEAILADAVARLGDMPDVTGFAILLTHDGWLHLPGVTWGLDDTTFGRFLRAMGEQDVEMGDNRFAARGRLVTGPLRNEWLSWRSAEIKAFYARIAGIVRTKTSRTLFVMPTTLLATGEIAARFRPQAATATPDSDLLRELGLVAALPADMPADSFLFVLPHVATPAARLADRSTVAAASDAMATALSLNGFPAHAAAIIVRPVNVSLADVLPHGPFPSATLTAPCRAAIAPPTTSGDAMLARALATSDTRIVFDTRLATASAPSEASLDRSFDLLPATPFDKLPDVPEPLVVLTRPVGNTTWVLMVNAGPAPIDTTLRLTGPAGAVINARSGTAVPMTGEGVMVALAAWDTRVLVIEGGGTVADATTSFPPSVRAVAAAAMERARQRLGVLVAPEPLEVLDNPGFELGIADTPVARMAPAVTGWELLEPRRGALELVSGMAQPAAPVGRALRFSSRNGLSTVRSNPFNPPPTGRISVAAWLRLDPGDPQPPLRIAIEGVEGNREYYRFAPVGGLTGGRSLTSEWALFVLQVDDLPAESVESLRVRFDLLGPGSVQIDEVRVYDLAFDESQRTEIAKTLARIDHRLKAGDVGGAIVELEGHWPTFLETFVSDDAVAACNRAAAGPQATVAPSPPDAPRQGMLDRFRGWW